MVAVGVNCTSPAVVGPAVADAARTGKPVVVYPNSGEGWDATARGWTGVPGLAADAVQGWVGEGARLIGGCCRVRPSDIAVLARRSGDLIVEGPGHQRC